VARAAVAALALAALVLTGCASSSATASDQTKDAASANTDTHTLEFDGVERSYIAHVPDGAAIGAPLTLPVLVVLHGAGGNGIKAETATALSGYASTDNFIVVYPNGTQAADIPGQLSWNAGACCGAPVTNDVDDVGFIEAVLDDVEREYAVDTERVFLAGFSNGGMLSYRLSCELGDRIAGLAVVGGAFNVSSCSSDAAASVLIVHGTADQTVPYAGGATNPRTAARFGGWNNASVAQATSIWIERNGCDSDPETALEGAAATAVYSGCDDGGSLEVVSIANGGHVWPIAPVSGFDASEYLVHYFGLDS
jgi:polyhydroxybutyrate depolymerase